MKVLKKIGYVILDKLEDAFWWFGDECAKINNPQTPKYELLAVLIPTAVAVLTSLTVTPRLLKWLLPLLQLQPQ